MSIQEKDCRRCEKYNGEGVNCDKGTMIYNPQYACSDEFTPISGRDCRNCERFSGKDVQCSDAEHSANGRLDWPCSNYNPLPTSKPSPTILTYTDREGDKIRVTKSDKILSLHAIWVERPCGDEYRAMSIAFTQAGFNPDTEIDFIQNNLDRLSDIAFHWLLGEGFLIEAEEEKVVYKIGQWFEGTVGGKYLICEDFNSDRGQSYILVYITGGMGNPGTCTRSIGKTEEELSNQITSHWTSLKPIDSPLVNS